MEHFSAKFLVSPEIYQEIYEFCKTIPEYQKARDDAGLALQQLETLIGYEKTAHFEAVLNNYYAVEAKAHYLFGLNLRQELRAELFT